MPVVKFGLAMVVTVRVELIEGDCHGALIHRTAVKKKREGGGGGGGGSKYLSGPIDTKRRGCCTCTSASIQRAGLSGEVDARDICSQVRACV